MASQFSILISLHLKSNQLTNGDIFVKQQYSLWLFNSNQIQLMTEQSEQYLDTIALCSPMAAFTLSNLHFQTPKSQQNPQLSRHSQLSNTHPSIFQHCNVFSNLIFNFSSYSEAAWLQPKGKVT